jgi:hypothetical protein
VSAFIRPLPPDNHADEQPSPSAELSVVVEPAPDATIGELARNLATAILNAVSDRIFARPKDSRRKISQRQPSPPGS